MGASLAEALPKEIERCQELLEEYVEIGGPGRFACVMLKQEIKEAVDAQASGDVVQMVVAYKKLQDCC
jgi:hydrogenase maturation factor